jgi:hypothetical protein
MALLALNALGVLIVTEYTYRDRPGFDSPAVRGGKQLAAMAIALGLVVAFQLAILRRPARRVLRKSLARVYTDLLTYHIILTKAS